MRRLILFLAAFQLFSLSAFGTTFYCSYWADTASASTVKLIRNGKIFTDVTDVYTMVWNATTEVYEGTLDDATFTEDYYRIEDGAANVVVKDFFLSSYTLPAGNIQDVFVRNDQDDTMVGELSVKPGSSTDTQIRIGNESASGIYIWAENAAQSADRNLVIGASSIALYNHAGTSAQITNLAPGASALHAVNKSQLDSARGAGWDATMTLAAHETRLDNLEGSGTFSSAACTLQAVGYDGGIEISWAMNSSANDSAVLRYELYRATRALAGHASGTLTTNQLTTLRARMTRVNLSTIRETWADVPTFRSWYFIVVAFDHDSPYNIIGSNQVFASPGSVIDPTTAIIGGANSYNAALTTLAEKVYALDEAAEGKDRMVIYSDNQRAGTTVAQNDTALTTYTYQDTATNCDHPKVWGALYRPSGYDSIAAFFQARVAHISEGGNVSLYLLDDDVAPEVEVGKDGTGADTTWTSFSIKAALSDYDVEVGTPGYFSLQTIVHSSGDTLQLRRVVVIIHN